VIAKLRRKNTDRKKSANAGMQGREWARVLQWTKPQFSAGRRRHACGMQPACIPSESLQISLWHRTSAQVTEIV